MVEQVGNNLFNTIQLGLSNFRKALEGKSGDKLRQMGDVQGPVASFIRTLLQKYYQALQGFSNLMILAEKQMIQADGGIACLEVFSSSLVPLSDPAVLKETPRALGLPEEPFTVLSQAIDATNKLLQTGLKMSEVLPSPEVMKGIRDELEILLGVPERNIEGAYTNLLESLKVSVPQLSGPQT